MKMIKGLLYDKNGNLDEQVLGMHIGWIILTCLECYALSHGQPFDPSSFAIGFGTIATGAGAGKFLTERN